MDSGRQPAGAVSAADAQVYLDSDTAGCVN
jgi:hypothetical protein